MAYEAPLGKVGIQNAGANLSTNQYYAVKLDTTAAGCQVILGAASTDAIIGILQNKPTSGQAAEVVVHGISKFIAGGSITAGDLLTVNSAGKLITATLANTQQRIIGQALMTVASGDTGSVYLYGTAVPTPTPTATGWTQWTGVGSTGSFATASATTANCAQAIKSIIDALFAAGIISN